MSNGEDRRDLQSQINELRLEILGIHQKLDDLPTKEETKDMISNAARDRILSVVKIVAFNILTAGGLVLAGWVSGVLHIGDR